MNTTFEQRLKDFIQEHFALKGSQWETVLSEDNVDIWKDFAPEVTIHESIYYTIKGKYDVHFVLEESVLEIDWSDPADKWKETEPSAKSPTKSNYYLVLCANKPTVQNHHIDYGFRLTHISWSPSSLHQDTNGISELRIKLITPTFRPFERCHYIMDFMNRVVTIPFHDSD